MREGGKEREGWVREGGLGWWRKKERGGEWEEEGGREERAEEDSQSGGGDYEKICLVCFRI